MEVLEINSAGMLVKDSKSHFVLQAEEKKSFNKMYMYGGIAILGGGAAFYLMNSEEESKETGSVSVTIEIP